MRSFPFILQAPRHPLARIALGTLGLALLGFFTVFGLVIAAIGLAGYALHRIHRKLTGRDRRPPNPFDPRIIEGEFSVVEKPRLPR
jgi:hypothetical protein